MSESVDIKIVKRIDTFNNEEFVNVLRDLVDRIIEMQKERPGVNVLIEVNS